MNAIIRSIVRNPTQTPVLQIQRSWFFRRRFSITRTLLPMLFFAVAPLFFSPSAYATDDPHVSGTDLPHPPVVVEADWNYTVPMRPHHCDNVAPGQPLQSAIDAADDGAVLCLGDGDYPGHIVINRPITLWGTHKARIVSSGTGTTVSVLGHDVTLAGFTVDGSGHRFDQTDAAVRVEGFGHVVSGLKVLRATFGILVEKSSGCTVFGNHVSGDLHAPFGTRGDGIRLWETRATVVDNNRVDFSRDVVVWYSSHNIIQNNLVTGGRYGTHFMYSHNNLVQNNRYLSNIVGLFVMYSRNVVICENTLAGSFGASGIALGIKESGNLTILRNTMVRNTIGIYLDTSPLNVDDYNRLVSNSIRLGGVAVAFHGRTERNTFVHNVFTDNLAMVEVEGGGDAMSARWITNEYSDYAGYDLDNDGLGDVAYEQSRLSSHLLGQHPSLAFFRSTPAMFATDTVQHALPLFPPKILLRDDYPKMGNVDNAAATNEAEESL